MKPITEFVTEAKEYIGESKTLPPEMEAGIKKLFAAAAKNYSEGYPDRKAEKEKEYLDGMSYSVGGKYIKLITGLGGQRSVYGFIVNTKDDPKFKYGDMLKAAGWNAPATNFSRGNVLEFDKVKTVNWTSIM